jgi:hypothetical protein
VGRVGGGRGLGGAGPAAGGGAGGRRRVTHTAGEPRAAAQKQVVHIELRYMLYWAYF